MKILFVCTGNTCRSPMAAAILKNMAKPEDNLNIISGGLAAPVGEKASGNAVAVMDEMGIDIRNHTAKNINADVISQADLILTMSKAHKAAIESAAKGKVYTLSEFAGEEGGVPDPYGGSIEEYRQCRDMIESLVKKVYRRIKNGRNKENEEDAH